MSSMQQLQALQKGGPMALTTVPKPTPDANEVVIRAKAVGLNPVDAKSFYRGEVVFAWPVVLGIEVAGIVDSVGADVTAYQPGDEVCAFTTRLINGEKGSAFQEYVVVGDKFVGKKPASLSFEEAASIPIAYSTALSTILVGLQLPIPGLTTTTPTNPLPKSILVIGGSSACGSHAIQLLRLALGPSAHIVATSSPQHHTFLTTQLGASAALDRTTDQASLEALKAASPDGTGFDLVLDAVGASLEQQHLFHALRSDGPKVYVQIFTGPSNVAAPEGTTFRRVMGMQLFKDTDRSTRGYELLGELLEEGKYKLPVEVEVVGKGWEAVEGGVEKLSKGVSRTKLVVSV